MNGRNSLFVGMLLILVAACHASAVIGIFKDDSETGSLANWTIGGRQQGVNSATIETRHSSEMAHLHPEGYSEITLSKTFGYDPNMRFHYDMETHVETTFSSFSDSRFVGDRCAGRNPKAAACQTSGAGST